MSCSFSSNAPPTPEIYTLSLHDALPICCCRSDEATQKKDRTHSDRCRRLRSCQQSQRHCPPDRKSTRLNSSHVAISYAVFCLKKKTLQEQASIANMAPTSGVNIGTLHLA